MFHLFSHNGIVYLRHFDFRSQDKSITFYCVEQLCVRFRKPDERDKNLQRQGKKYYTRSRKLQKAHPATLSIRFDNHNSKAVTTSKIHSIIERKNLPNLAIHLERIIDRVVITGSNIISPRTIIRDVTFCNSIPRKIASVFSLYKNHSRHERFVQSRAIWVLSRVDSLSLVPTRCFFSRFSARKNSASTVVSVFLCATSATSLRGTDKIDFSLAVRCRRRLQRQQRHRQRRR